MEIGKQSGFAANVELRAVDREWLCFAIGLFLFPSLFGGLTIGVALLQSLQNEAGINPFGEGAGRSWLLLTLAVAIEATAAFFAWAIYAPLRGGLETFFESRSSLEMESPLTCRKRWAQRFVSLAKGSSPVVLGALCTTLILGTGWSLLRLASALGSSDPYSVLLPALVPISIWLILWLVGLMLWAWTRPTSLAESVELRR